MLGGGENPGILRFKGGGVLTRRPNSLTKCFMIPILAENPALRAGFKGGFLLGDAILSEISRFKGGFLLGTPVYCESHVPLISKQIDTPPWIVITPAH